MRESGKILAANIKAERSRCGLSQEDVSQQLGITRETYISYEKDASKLSSSKLIKLSEILKCNISAFFVNFESTKHE